MPQQLLAKEYLSLPAKRALKGPVRLYLRWLETSDHIIAATETIAARFAVDTVTVVRNYPTSHPGEHLNQPVGRRPERVAYIGLLTYERGVETMLRSLGQREFPCAWTLQMAGQFYPPSYAETLESWPQGSRVKYHGTLPPQEARNILKSCRVGLAVLHDTPNYRESLPTKMFEYFAAGMPVIASDFPLWRTIIEENDCGVLVAPDSPLELASAIRKYADDPVLLQRHSTNALRASQEHYNWDTQAALLLRVYTTINDKTSHGRFTS